MSTRDVPAQIGDLPAIGRPANRALPHYGTGTTRFYTRTTTLPRTWPS
jgi:hypothetical protein